MSDGLICDRCGKAFRKQETTTMKINYLQLKFSALNETLASLFAPYQRNDSRFVELCYVCAIDFGIWWTKGGKE